MQVPKQDVRLRIIAAATQEFLAHGYRQASIRRIAECAAITAGNIYAYFASKEALFEDVVQPVIHDLEHFIATVSKGERFENLNLHQLTDQLITIFLNHKIIFLILLNQSQGSKHENLRDELSALISTRIEEDLLVQLSSPANSLLAQALAAGLVESILFLFQRCGDDTKKLRRTLEEYILLMFHDIHLRIPASIQPNREGK